MPQPRIRTTENALKLLELRRELYNEAVSDLQDQLWAGQLSVPQWKDKMRQEIKDLHISAAVIAKGGEWSAMTPADWGRVGAAVRGQYGYLSKFADQVQAGADAALLGVGNLQSVGYLQTRAKMYGGAARGTFWRGLTYGMLPQVPGDGKTQCLTNCGCDLRIEDGADPYTLNVTWVINSALENCPDCIQLSGEWNPYVVTAPAEMVDAADNLGLSALGIIAEIIRKDFAMNHLGHHKHKGEHVHSV